ncbi:MAG: Asp-tRNA(Asn)/Glu-tRNA(Gln) amidotransferase subunit GatB [Myxococcaceae bacterium]|jgi:aspartyl-tRNA(Asn)/glutamyl-tRNA(Gln) amidotransferase subunit B|nr:Asp-tRNA(Asn)/Glu-tRNA(Gln) amidotransferase subunit GatB [Myxococcaceae bacterium]
MPRADYQVVIGLEVHAQLLTTSKLFSGASTSFGGAPNAHTSVVCLGLPGVLPVVNRHAIELAIRAGLALECRIANVSEWSRKHYFYPDLPKGYQVTQYEHPLCLGGRVVFDTPEGEKAVRLTRIHVEEDAGKLVHEGAASLVDLNRAGTPLIEIVSEPELRSADDAVEYLKALRDVLVWVGVNDGNLEEGSFRCDANVSVMKHDATTFGTRCELKNLNSFRFIKQAIEVEAQRHVELLESGGVVEQETRLFDPQRGETRSMRSKEDAHDYRYFPEPDLPPLVLGAGDVDSIREALPELPRARRARYVTSLGLSAYDAQVLTADRAFSDFFERCVAEAHEAKPVANWFMGELSRLLNETNTTVGEVKFSPAQLAALLRAVKDGVISGPGAKEVFAELFATGKDVQVIIDEKGLAQVNDDGPLLLAIEQALAESPKNVESYRGGNTKIVGYFVGQVMKKLGGKGNPKRINELLVEKLKG